MDVRILHNPRCSKSRATLGLLQDRGIEPEVIRYLETPPDAEQLKAIVAALGCSARDIVRKGEPEYRDLGLDDPQVGDERLIEAMAAVPKLIERPIVLANGRAAIGRPPESVLRIL